MRPLTELRPLTDDSPLTELRPLTDDSPLTELRPLTDDSPLTELRPLTDDSPLTELRPLTDDSPKSCVADSTLLGSSPHPMRPTIAPMAMLIWIVLLLRSLTIFPPLRRPGRLRESRGLCVTRSLG